MDNNTAAVAQIKKALEPLANLDLTGVNLSIEGNVIYQRNGTYITVGDVMLAIQVISNLPEQFTTDREWVSVEDRLPTGGIRCWVCQNWTYVNEGYYEDNRWKGWTDYEGLDFVTHWKEFTEPEPPKK